MTDGFRRTTIRLLVGICFISSAMTASAESLSSALGGAILPQWQFEEARQYDFWIGEWRANWRSRPEREILHQEEGTWPPPNSSYAFLDQLQGFKHHGRVQVFSGVTDADGNPQVRRYTFSDIAPDRLRWDDAGRIVLNADPELTIASDFSPPAWLGKVIPENPQERTV